MTKEDVENIFYLYDMASILQIFGLYILKMSSAAIKGLNFLGIDKKKYQFYAKKHMSESELNVSNNLPSALPKNRPAK